MNFVHTEDQNQSTVSFVSDGLISNAFFSESLLAVAAECTKLSTFPIREQRPNIIPQIIDFWGIDSINFVVPCPLMVDVASTLLPK